jgi:hypothetical protein
MDVEPADPDRGICCPTCRDEMPSPTPPFPCPTRPTRPPRPSPMPPVNCSAVSCLRPVCEYGELFTPPNQCCPTCALPCADGETPVNCFVDPCVGARCRGFPDAVCVSDYCGGCNARFFLDGEEVTCGLDCAAVTCPALPPDCDEEDQVPIRGGCCFACSRTK